MVATTLREYMSVFDKNSVINVTVSRSLSKPQNMNRFLPTKNMNFRNIPLPVDALRVVKTYPFNL